jgi:glycerophosphoryl diester phosphodiesterase
LEAVTSPGRLLAQALANAVREWEPAVTARGAIDHLTAVAKGLNAQRAESNEELASASVIAFSFARSEVWRVGDCLLRLEGIEYPPKNDLEQNVASVRAAYNQIMLRAGKSIADLRARDFGRELVLPLLKTQNVLANEDSESRYAFGVINGVPVPDRHLEMFKLPVNCRDVVMCSDGYPQAHSSLHEAESRLTEALNADPLCIARIIATKGIGVDDCSYDDRAYVRLQMM